MRMNEEIGKLVALVGKRKAARLVMEAIDCGPSKADKIINFRYPPELSSLEVSALTKMISGHLETGKPLLKQGSVKVS